MEERSEKELRLRKLYYEYPKTKYRSVDHLYELAKEKYPHLRYSKYFIKQWLLGQSDYTRFKKWNHPKHFRKTFVRDFDQFQIDLVILPKYKGENRGYENILVAIEILSRFAFVVPLKSKAGSETTEGIEKIFKEFYDQFGKYPKFVQFDEGNEFKGKEIDKFFSDNRVTSFFTDSPRKAAVVERLNRTIKTMMMRNFEEKKNHNWIDYIESFVDVYNNSVNSSIGMKPIEVGEENKYKVWLRLYGKMMEIKKPRYKVGDKVRVLKLNIQYRVAQLRARYQKNRFEKREGEKLFGDYFKEKYKDHDPEKVIAIQHAANVKRPPFSAEIFKIEKILLGDPNVYKLYSEEFNRKVPGIFYAEELSLVK